MGHDLYSSEEANIPNWLVGNDDLSPLGLGNTLSDSVKLSCHYLNGSLRLAFLQLTSTR